MLHANGCANISQYKAVDYWAMGTLMSPWLAGKC
jgi:hypothetical protein